MFGRNMCNVAPLPKMQCLLIRDADVHDLGDTLSEHWQVYFCWNKISA